MRIRVTINGSKIINQKTPLAIYKSIQRNIVCQKMRNNRFKHHIK